MTREQLVALAVVILAASVVSIVVKGYLFWRAWRARVETRSQPRNAPERIVADGEFWSSTWRLVQVVHCLAFGVLIGVAILVGQFRLDGIGGWILAYIFVMFSMLPLISGVGSRLAFKRLDDSMRINRDDCAETSFEGCPLITPARLEVVRSVRIKAAEVAKELGGLQEDLETT